VAVGDSVSIASSERAHSEEAKLASWGNFSDNKYIVII
jgi:hypothetical protein